MKNEIFKLLCSCTTLLLLTACENEPVDFNKATATLVNETAPKQAVIEGDNVVHMITLTPVTGQAAGYINNERHLETKPLDFNSNLFDINAVYINADDVNPEMIEQFKNSKFFKNISKSKTSIIIDSNEDTTNDNLKRISTSLNLPVFEDVKTVVFRHIDGDTLQSIPLVDTRKHPGSLANSIFNVKGFFYEDCDVTEADLQKQYIEYNEALEYVKASNHLSSGESSSGKDQSGNPKHNNMRVGATSNPSIRTTSLASHVRSVQVDVKDCERDVWERCINQKFFNTGYGVTFDNFARVFLAYRTVTNFTNKIFLTFGDVTQRLSYADKAKKESWASRDIEILSGVGGPEVTVSIAEGTAKTGTWAASFNAGGKLTPSTDVTSWVPIFNKEERTTKFSEVNASAGIHKAWTKTTTTTTGYASKVPKGKSGALFHYKDVIVDRDFKNIQISARSRIKSVETDALQEAAQKGIFDFIITKRYHFTFNTPTSNNFINKDNSKEWEMFGYGGFANNFYAHGTYVALKTW